MVSGNASDLHLRRVKKSCTLRDAYIVLEFLPSELILNKLPIIYFSNLLRIHFISRT